MSGSEVQPIRALASVPLHLIKTERNVREQLTGLAELAESIRVLGVLQPITVQRATAGGFTIVFGHRRVAASRLAGRDAIPALIVGDYSPSDRLARQMAENTGRVPLDPIEEARGYKRMRELGTTVPAIAHLCGVSQNTVYTRLNLLELPQTEQIRLRKGETTLGEAQQVAQLVKTRKAGAVLHRTPPSRREPHFGAAHPLATTARHTCTHTDIPRRAIACEPCWEAAIRADERAHPGGDR